MKELSSNQEARAFTLVELLLLIAVLAIVALMLLPAIERSRPPLPARRAPCLDHLHRIGIAFCMFAGDHGGLFPPQCSITNDGSMECIGSNSAASHLSPLLPYLGKELHCLVCPADGSRKPALRYTNFGDSNLSYFCSIDAAPAVGSAVLAGDRNLESSGRPVKSGLFVLTTNAAVGWTGEMHSKREAGRRGGCILFADHHVEYVHDNLSAVIQRQGIATNRLAIP